MSGDTNVSATIQYDTISMHRATIPYLTIPLKSASPEYDVIATHKATNLLIFDDTSVLFLRQWIGIWRYHWMRYHTGPSNQLEIRIQEQVRCYFVRSLYSHFFSWYSMAAFRLKASIKAVSCSTSVFPTLFTSIPSVVMPTPSSVHKKTPTELSIKK